MESESRRDAIKKIGAAGVAGAAVWVVPTMTSASAIPAVGSNPPPPCFCPGYPYSEAWATVPPVSPAGGFLQYDSPNSLGSTGWQVTNGSVQVVSAGFYTNGAYASPPPSSPKVVDMSADTGGTIARSFDLCAGSWALSFQVGGNNVAPSYSPDSGAWSLVGGPISHGGPINPNWNDPVASGVPYSDSFTLASSQTLTLTFSCTDTDPAGWLLGAVHLDLVCP